MKIKGHYLSKNNVEFCTEDFTLKAALEKLYQTGYRCIPVLDKAGKRFLGNVYKVHVLEFEKECGHLDASVLEVVANGDGYVYQDSSFSKIFVKIKELPYITVLDESGVFSGILTHKNVIELLEDSWGIKSGSYSITIGASESSGSLRKLLSVVNKITDIQSLLTLDGDSKLVRRVEITLPKDVKEEELERLGKKIVRSGFKIIDIEKL